MTDLSQDQREWLEALDEIPRGAGEIARRAGHGRGANMAFAHFARQRPDLVSRQILGGKAGARFVYRKGQGNG